jgi:hypothetical protein
LAAIAKDGCTSLGAKAINVPEVYSSKDFFYLSHRKFPAQNTNQKQQQIDGKKDGNLNRPQKPRKLLSNPQQHPKNNGQEEGDQTKHQNSTGSKRATGNDQVSNHLLVPSQDAG